MSKLEVKESFKKDGGVLEEGKTYTVPKRIADWAEAKGYGSRPGKNSQKQVPKLEAPEPGDVWEELKRMVESQQEKPPDWYPQKGGWLFGTVVGTGKEKNGRFAVVEVAKRPARAKSGSTGVDLEVKTVWPGEKVMVWEVRDLSDFFDRIQAGLKVALQYKGKIKTPSGHEAKIYNTAVEDWILPSHRIAGTSLVYPPKPTR